MSNLLQKYSKITRKLLFWNFVLLVMVKLVLPNSAFQLASLIGSIPTYDSREVIRLSNEARMANGLSPLRANVNLDIAASEKLNDMAIREYFAHVSPTGIDPWYWIEAADYSYTVAGENLALGFYNANDTVDAWLNSPSHRDNLLNNKYRDIGVAVKGVSINGREGVLVVQMFGATTRLNTPPVASVLETPKPSVAPQIAFIQNSEEVQGVLAENIVDLQPLSTDISVAPVSEPRVVSFRDTEVISTASGILNNVYSAYALTLMLLSMIFFFMVERTRHNALGMSLNICLFIMSIAIPVSQMSIKGLIF